MHSGVPDLYTLTIDFWNNSCYNKDRKKKREENKNDKKRNTTKI